MLIRSALPLCLGGVMSLSAAAQIAPDGNAPDEPLWEVRLGATALHGPVYPGASETKLNGVGAPLFIYRGDRFRIGEYGVARAIASETKSFQLDISVDAAYSASDAEAREGMPDLDYLFQIGPQAVWHAMDTGWTEEGRKQLSFFLPVRGVAASDFTYIEHAGWLAEPAITYRSQKAGDLRSSWSATLFASFADEQLMDRLYGVAPAFATIDRPVYSADGGYLSTGARVSWMREFTEDFQVFLTWQGRAFSGSANEDSPLLQEDFTSAVSVSFVWKMLKSQRPAKNSDM